MQSSPLYLIAEIGINHNGDLQIAKDLIRSAAEAGFNAVKFQKRTIGIVYQKEFLDSPRESPWGTTQRAQKEGLELSHDDYREIRRYCSLLGIDWSASCWDLESAKFLRTLSPQFNKIASAMLGHRPLLREVAAEQKRTFVSTGMSTLDEIDEAANIFKQANCPFELMHCNSTYPMREEDANLLCIPMLKERYGVPVGYSGHETSLVKVCVAAVTLGATSLERHITLDRTMYGSDQAASIEAHHLRDFVATVRAIPQILGTGQKMMTAGEIVAREKLRADVPDEPQSRAA